MNLPPKVIGNLIALASAQLRGERLPPQAPLAMSELWSDVGQAELLLRQEQEKAQQPEAPKP